MMLLEVEGLEKSFIKDRVRFSAVDGVSFTIAEGECFGLIGESGCGKSTVARLIVQLLKEDKGSIRFLGKDLTKKAGEKQVRRAMQMIFQNPTDSFDPRYSLLDSVKQGLRFLEKVPKEELDRLAKEAIAFVGLKESYYRQPVHQLSGGECQRAAIARAILGNPQLIICDEATSALDVSVQAQVVSLLKRLQREQGTAYLFITHDLILAQGICSRIAVMYQGRLVECGDAQRIIHSPLHPYTQMLVSCILPPRVTTGFSPMAYERLREPAPDGCGFYAFCPRACADCRAAVPSMQGDAQQQAACCRIV